MCANNTGSDSTNYYPPPLTRDKVQLVFVHVFLPVKAYSVSVIFAKFMAVIYMTLLSHRTEINDLELSKTLSIVQWLRFSGIFLLLNCRTRMSTSINYCHSINTNERWLLNIFMYNNYSILKSYLKKKKKDLMHSLFHLTTIIYVVQSYT